MAPSDTIVATLTPPPHHQAAATTCSGVAPPLRHSPSHPKKNTFTGAGAPSPSDGIHRWQTSSLEHFLSMLSKCACLPVPPLHSCNICGQLVPSMGGYEYSMILIVVTSPIAGLDRDRHHLAATGGLKSRTTARPASAAPTPHCLHETALPLAPRSRRHRRAGRNMTSQTDTGLGQSQSVGSL